MSITSPQLPPKLWCSNHQSHFQGQIVPCIHYKERWHSDGCILYFRGGHHWNLDHKGSHPSIGCAPLFHYGISSSGLFPGWATAHYSQNCKNNGIAGWDHHCQGYCSFRSPCYSVPSNVMFKSLKWGERVTYTSPTNSPKWGNTMSSPSRTWGPCWPWAVSAHGVPNTGNCAMQNKHAPQQPLQTNGYTHQAVESLKRMTRRSPFQEGEGGVHWGNPLHLESQSNELEEGFPLDHPHKCYALLHPGQIWGNWLPPWHQVCTWAPQKSILLVVMLPLAKQRYHLNNGTMRFNA